MRLSLLAAATLCVSSIAAHATPVTFDISGYLNTNVNVTVTGMAILDICTSGPCTTSPSVQNIYLNFSNGTFQSGIGTLGQDDNTTVYVGRANDKLTFTDNLHDYTLAGGTFNLVDASGDYVGQVFNGTLPTVPPSSSVTPEPSSFALLGTGLLGVAGVVRKRFA